MTLGTVPQILPAVMGRLRQEGADGELRLEQNDGCRRLFWQNGDLVYLHSDVAGEQFGNYLLRQGILDFAALQELLGNDESGRLGEKVVLWGLMSPEERDCHLLSLQEQIMIHALEHPLLRLEWKPGPVELSLSQDLHFQIQHRLFVWQTFQEARGMGEICDLLYQEEDWRWVSPPELLKTVEDLPLNPQVAYAITFFGAEPLGYGTFLQLCGMEEESAARLIVTLWALGTLTLAEGELPGFSRSQTPSRIPSWNLPQAGEVPAPPEPPLLAAPPPPPLPPQAEAAGSGEGLPGAVPPGTPPPETLQAPLEAAWAGSPGAIQLDHPVSSLEAPDGETPAQRARRLFARGRQHAQHDRTVEAIRALEQGLQLDPDSPVAYEPWMILGRLRMANPAWSTRAIEAFQTAARLRPRNAEPWAQMGILYYRKGFRTNATGCFKKAMELDSTFVLPEDVDLKEEMELGTDVITMSSQPTGILGRLRSILGGRGREG